ncbi:MAG: LPS export ABC transporter permease LptF [Desulfuromonadaceae bacterium]|nr:LPS export ABC transporter permease LptF [Desulfuromonadaceae bacterium]
MRAHRIQTYILRETLSAFLLGLALFTIVLLLSRLLNLIELVVDKGVPARQMLSLFGCLLPSFLVITLPLAFLLAVLLVFGRLSAESELVAMKAGGLSLHRLAQPIFMLALVVSFATAAMSLFGEPLGREHMRQQLIHIALDRAAVAIQPQIFNDAFEGLTLYADQVSRDGGELSGVFVCDQRTGTHPATVFAQQGRLQTEKTTGELLMHLSNGTIHRIAAKEDKQSYQIIRFSRYDINLSANSSEEQQETKAKKAKDLTITELLTQLDSQKKDKQPEWRAEIHERFILPLSPILFALLAIPLGTRSHRSNRGGGFAVALCIFMLYYMLLSLSKTLVIEKSWPVTLTLATPSVLFLLIGLFFYLCAVKERPLPGQKQIALLTDGLSDILSRRK